MGNFSIPNLSATNSNLAQAKSDLAVQGLRNSATKSDPSKIDKAARDFESLLVGQWLEKAEKSFASVPGTDPDANQDASHDQFQSIACEYLARGLSKTGGFGIARMISKHLEEAASKQTGDAAKTDKTAEAVPLSK